LQAPGHPEHPALAFDVVEDVVVGVGHVLTEDPDPLVGGQELVQSEADGVRQQDRLSRRLCRGVDR
jgi:hypothetical protein